MFKKDNLLLIFGQIFSQFGQQMYVIGLLYWVMVNLDNPIYMSYFMISVTMPLIIFSPIGGMFADKFSKRNIIGISDIFCGLVMFIGYICLINLTEIKDKFILITIISFFVSLSFSFFQPALLSFIPFLSKDISKLKKTNALIQSTEQLSKTIGLVAGGALIISIGLENLILITSIGFLLSGISELFIKEKGLNEIIIKEKIKLEAIKYLKNNKDIMSFFLLVIMFNFLYSPFMVFLPLHLNEAGYEAEVIGLLMGVYAFGQLMSFLFVFLSKVKINDKNLIELSFVMSSLMLFLLVIFKELEIKLLILFIQGFFIGLINVLLISLLQEKIKKEIQGKVFGLLKLFAGLAMPIGMLLSGIYLKGNNGEINNIFMFSGVLIIALFLIFKFKVDGYKDFYKK